VWDRAARKKKKNLAVVFNLLIREVVLDMFRQIIAVHSSNVYKWATSAYSTIITQAELL